MIGLPVNYKNKKLTDEILNEIYKIQIHNIYKSNINKLAKLYFSDKEKFINDTLNSISNIEDNLELLKFIDELTIEIYNGSFDNGKKGILYCLYNKFYDFVGENVYKLGYTKNLKKRLSSYTTCYLENMVVKASTTILQNAFFAETILFHILDKYRIKKNREFFKCPLDEIKKVFSQVEDMFKTKQNIIIAPNAFNNIKIDILNLLDNKDLKTTLIKSIQSISALKLEMHKIDIYKILEIGEKDIIDINLIDANINKYQQITQIFELPKLSHIFLKDLNSMTNVYKFNNSLLYFNEEIPHNDILDQDILDIYLKKCTILKDMIKLFWLDGILCNKTIKIITSKTNFPLDQKTYIDTNKNDIFKLFEQMKRKVVPKTSYQIIDCIKTLMQELFGNFIFLEISGRKNKRHRNIYTNYYNVTINPTKYIELVLHKSIKSDQVFTNKDINIIKTKWGDYDCAYSDIHGYNKISDMIQ
ncbi:MAG: hypothetical protein Homavirus6_7 [Homavirus sp.]|uniref:Bacteriophage T5 Orf172 DNA-binding domain-containing protein n=1 Tax=Homavirus sp. TaxID=2487769 RepID=A0A3G5A4C3_9VIRU|nr:MAG: hypothetical protein Homavirus6_7 [Homavirus sp.]